MYADEMQFNTLVALGYSLPLWFCRSWEMGCLLRETNYNSRVLLEKL